MQTKHAKPPMRRLLQAGILLCLMMMAGCKSDELIQSYRPDEKMLIEEAKMSYKDQFKSLNGFDRYFANPLWEYYSVAEDSLFNSVVIPFEPLSKEVYAYLMISIPKDNNEERIYTLRVFNYEYAKKLAKNSYHSYTLQQLNTPKNTIEKGYIKNNKWVTTEKITSEELGFNTILTRTMVSKDCEDCPVEGGSLDEVVITAPKKKDKGTGGPTTPIIPTIPSLPQPGDPGFPNLPGGGGGGSYPSVKPLSPVLKALFKGKNSLTDADTEKLNKAVDEMLQKCFYNTINNYLTSKGVQLNDIKMDPDLANRGGQAAVDNLGNLIIGESDQINTDNLEHEWTHLFQRAYLSMGKEPWGDKKGMIEYEVALKDDIIELIKYKGDWNIIPHSWVGFNMENIIYQPEYQKWLDKLTSNGTSYPTSIDQKEFEYFAKIFAEVSYRYGYGKKDEDYVNGKLINPVDYTNVRGRYTYVGVNYPASVSVSLYNEIKTNCKL